MPSLTVTEARTRAASLRVTSYDVHLDLTLGDQDFASRARIEFESRDGADTFLDVQPAELINVNLNGNPLDTNTLTDGRLPLSGLQASNRLTIEARMTYSHDGEGLHRSLDPEDGLPYVYAMSFLDAAPRIYGCFDQPDLKAPYRLTVNAPPGWTVLGNGHATTTGDNGRWEFAETEPLSTYFVTLVAGPYHSRTVEHDGIRLGLHCRQSLAAHLDKDAEEIFTVTRQCFDEYHRLFGIRYAFGDYHQAFVPEFNAGAMENPGCVTFRDDLIFKAAPTGTSRASRAMVIAHEMAHQWFGNLVTMQWWDDLWLNESFAEYMGYRVTAHVTSFTDVWTDFTLSRKAWGMAADQRTSTHPVAGNGAQDAQQALNDFDGISYTKGASALRQLNAYLGDQVFLAGVVDHLTQHSFGNATLADLFAAWQRHTDKDVDAWAQAWLRTSGIDTLSVAHSSAGDVVIERANGSPVEVSRPHAIQVSWYGGGTSPQTTPLLVTQPATPVTWKAADGRGLVLPDSADESWVKVRLNPATLDEVPEALATIEDPIARAVIWGALREALRDGELNPERYLQIVESALPSEADSAVEEVLSQCSSSVGRFFGDTGAATRLATVAEQILNSAPPGSNRQLVAARALISLTPDTDQLHRWRDGSSPEGLLTDDDLRWRLTRALCGAGQLGTTDIEAELRRDPSSQGALRSLESRASLPDSEVKEDVWESITTAATLSNYSLYALAGHFFRADQLELTEPFVERYFDDVPKTARFRTGWVVQTTAQLAFPRYAVSPDTVRLAERCLARGDLDASTRRAVSDSLDDLRRALHSRTTFDGAA